MTSENKMKGMPVVISDNLMYAGHKTTCASKMLFNHTAPFTATAVQKLLDAGAVITLRAPEAEFAAGGVISLGGNLRFKPTYGRVSRNGLVAHASSMDRVEITAASARDIALMLSVIGGRDAADNTTSSLPVPDYEQFLNADVKGFKIGVLENSPKIETSAAEIVKISLPYMEYADACYNLISAAEFSANMERFDGLRYGYAAIAGPGEDLTAKTRAEGFGPEVKKKIITGQYVLSSENYKEAFVKAEQVRAKIRQDFAVAFKKCDVIVLPVSLSSAIELTGLPVINTGSALFAADKFKEENLFKTLQIIGL